MAGQDERRGVERPFGVALEDQLEDAAVEGVVPRLVLGHVAQHLGQAGLVLADDPARLAVGELGRPLLHRGVGEDPVGVAVPLRVEARAQILELHLLDLALVEQPGVAGVVVEHLAVPVFLGGPEIVPGAPVALVAQVDGQEPVEVGQAFLGQHVEREGRPDRVRDAVGLAAEVAGEIVGTVVGLGTEEVGREPELALPLVGFHELPHRLFQIPEHFDLQGQFARRVGGGAHVFPFTTVSLSLARQNDQPPKIQWLVRAYANRDGWSKLRRLASSRFSIRAQRPVADVVLPLEDAPPAQGAKQAFGPLVIGPELGQVRRRPRWPAPRRRPAAGGRGPGAAPAAGPPRQPDGPRRPAANTGGPRPNRRSRC